MKDICCHCLKKVKLNPEHTCQKCQEIADSFIKTFGGKIHYDKAFDTPIGTLAPVYMGDVMLKLYKIIY